MSLKLVLLSGVGLTALWAAAYIVSWIVQAIWSWVDETTISERNFVAALFDPAIPKDGWARIGGYYEYHKYEDGLLVAHDTTCPEGTIVDCRHIITSDISNYIVILPFIWIAALCVYFWYISVWVALAACVAYVARMARRGQKLLTAHIEDKVAHKEAE